MALMKCPDCGRKVSPRASACPECGCPSEYFEKTEQVEAASELSSCMKESISSAAEKDFQTNEYAAQIRTNLVI